MANATGNVFNLAQSRIKEKAVSMHTLFHCDMKGKLPLDAVKNHWMVQPDVNESYCHELKIRHLHVKIYYAPYFEEGKRVSNLWTLAVTRFPLTDGEAKEAIVSNGTNASTASGSSANLNTQRVILLEYITPDSKTVREVTLTANEKAQTVAHSQN